MAGICWIVGAGDFTPRDFLPSVDDLVIAADGGYQALESIGVAPRLLMGDMDSLAGKPPQGVQTLRYPVDKDDTDMGLAAREGYGRGYRELRLYGGCGGRMDHTLANIQLICRYSRMGCRARMVGRELDIYAVTNGTLMLPARPKDTLVSVFCLTTAATGVTLRGLRYPLDGATLSCDFALGVSNRHTGGEPASVSVESGTLYVIQYLQP